MKIVPILVGALGAESEATYGQLLAKYVDDPTNFFSVSSDFCHWGSRYIVFLITITKTCHHWLFLFHHKCCLMFFAIL